MGYSNYHGHIVPTAEIAADARKIVAQASEDCIAVTGPLGTGKPVLTRTEISLNGDAAKGEDYETFALYAKGHRYYSEIGVGYAFCKTGHRPYDAVVIAILISAFIRTGKVSSSDGTFGVDEEIAAGISLYERAVSPLDASERIDVEAMYL